MSPDSRFIPSVMIITLLIAFLATSFPWVKGEPDTTVTTSICNEDSYGENDPFGDSVAYVLADLMNVTPSQQGYNYYTVSPYPTSTAYGHATCSQALANSECANCLVAAKSTVSSVCAGRIGAQVGMVDCSMRYENYTFT